MRIKILIHPPYKISAEENEPPKDIDCTNNQTRHFNGSQDSVFHLSDKTQ